MFGRANTEDARSREVAADDFCDSAGVALGASTCCTRPGEVLADQSVDPF